MRCRIFEKGAWRESSMEEVTGLGANDAAWAWLTFDVSELGGTEFRRCAREMSLHPLAISDARRPRHPPKYERFDENDFLILREQLDTDDLDDYRFVPLSLFWTDSWLVTVEHGGSRAVMQTLEEMQTGRNRLFEHPVDMVARLARRVNDRYTERLLMIEERLESLEEAMAEPQSDAYLREVLGESTTLKQMARSLYYQHAAVKGAMEDHRGTSEHSEHLLQDAREQIDRAASLAQMLAAISSDLMNAFLSLHAHRLNRIMQVLTVFTAIFLPLTLVAGIYGMNFEHMPELQVAWGYPAVLIFMLSCVVGLLLLFRRLRWL
ncbi:MAG: magnesium transporter CorA family protein [Pseudomonadota bacterium]